MTPGKGDPWAMLLTGLLGSCLCGLEAASAAKPGETVAAAQADAGKKEAEPAEHDVFLPPDRSLLLLLSKARQLKEQGRHAEAVRCLGAILEAPEDSFFQPDKQSRVLPSLKAQAQAMLGAMPRQGRESYELLYGAQARTLLAKAVENGDINGLAEVSRRFFHTQAGYEATLLLGLSHLDRGSPLAGALVLKRLKENCPVVAQFEPGLSVAMAACWLRAAAPDKAKAALDGVRKQSPQGKLSVGGVELALGAEQSALLGSPTAGARESREMQQWLMFGGDPARNASTSGSGPLLSLCWRVPTTEDPFVESLLEQIQQWFEEQDRAALPAMHPLVVNDVVLMRTARNLLAVDFTTGKRLWEVPGEDPFESLLDPPGEAAGVAGLWQIDPGAAIRYRMWGDATFGTLSSDGQRVFCVEDLSLDIGVMVPRQTFFSSRRNTLADPKPFNRLAAYDVRTGRLVWQAGGPPSPSGSPLCGMFFLGPPLPVTGQLFGLAEQKGEIRLVVLDARTGSVAWTQHLAVVETESDILQDPIRRMAGSSPSYAEGVLICPTSNYAIVALDMANRSLLWGYNYKPREPLPPRQAGAFFAPPLEVDPEPGNRWTNSTAVIAEGHVLVTPADSTELHCLSLLDGRLLWSKPRLDSFYVACVHQGKVILVARRSMRALKLDNGEAAWGGSALLALVRGALGGRAVEFPGGAACSGTGFLSGDLYYVPLDNGEVASIDLNRGQLVHRYPGRRGVKPGNLVCYRGKILSQRAGAVEAFYQLDALRKELEGELAANPNDPQALALRGSVLWEEGKIKEAVTFFRRSLQIAPNPNTRSQLREALLEGLRTDFASYRSAGDEIQRLLEDPSQRASYLRLMAEGSAKLGQYRPALDYYLALVDLDRENRGLESIDKAHRVRRDRWVREQLTALRGAAPPDVQAEIDRVAQARLEAALKDGSAEALQRYLDYFAGWPPAGRARAELADRLRQSRRLLLAELQLRQMERSADRRQAASAVTQLGLLLGEARLSDDAALCYARLGREFAEVVCREGKTGRQLVESLPGDDPIARRLRPPAPWPRGMVVAKKSPQKPASPTYQAATVIPQVYHAEPFYAEVSLEVTLSPPLLTARDGWGNVRWQLGLGDLIRQGIPLMAPVFMRAAAQDHLLLMVMGTRIVALDTLVPEGTSPRILWTQDLDDPGRVAGGRRGTRLASGFNLAAARGYPQFGSLHFPTNVPSAVTEQMVCYQRYRHLYGVDPTTGDVLWTRDDARPDSIIFGDEQIVLVVPPDNSPAMVLRAADGKQLGTVRLPPPTERLAPYRRCLLLWQNVGSSMVLVLKDPWENRTVWSSRKFPLDCRVSYFGGGLVGVFELGGRFALFDVADGRTVVDAALPPEQMVSEMHLVRSPEGYLLVLNGVQRKEAGRPQPYGLHGVLVRPISRAHLYGFGPSGNLLWPGPVTVEDQFLIQNQPARLPLLLFAAGTWGRGGTMANQPRIALLGVDKRNGRVIRPEETCEGLGFLRLQGDPDGKTIEVHMPRDVLRLTFTDQVPPPATTGRALLKAASKAAADTLRIPSLQEISGLELPIGIGPARVFVPAERRLGPPAPVREPAKVLPPAPKAKDLQKPPAKDGKP